MQYRTHKELEKSPIRPMIVLRVLNSQLHRGQEDALW